MFGWVTSVLMAPLASAKAEKKADAQNKAVCHTVLTAVIVEAILEGKQPAALTLRDLMGAFPVEWEKQRKLLQA